MVRHPTGTVLAFDSLDDQVSCFINAEDPRRTQLWKDPADFYRRLRAAGPVYRAPDGRWLATTYAAASGLHLEDAWRREPDVDPESLSLAERVFRQSITFRDPPAHSKLRQSVLSLFTKRAMSFRRERVAEMMPSYIHRGLTTLPVVW